MLSALPLEHRSGLAEAVVPYLFLWGLSMGRISLVQQEPTSAFVFLLASTDICPFTSTSTIRGEQATVANLHIHRQDPQA